MLPYPEIIFAFHPPIFLMTLFFSHRPQISNSPYFPCFNNFPPVSRKLLFPPYFQTFLPVFKKFTCFLHTFCVHVFLSPLNLTMMHLCITQCTYWTPLDKL